MEKSNVKHWTLGVELEYTGRGQKKGSVAKDGVRLWSRLANRMLPALIPSLT
jgi:hypothetical protein